MTYATENPIKAQIRMVVPDIPEPGDGLTADGIAGAGEVSTSNSLAKTSKFSISIRFSDYDLVVILFSIADIVNAE